ncbi:CHASE2 domain-containing protein [Limnoraphis robusta Tam1]|uniref:CHASE2 domain-containing protein n=1 Tax=Limnoraphis robusta TaxID=1118279 RepID=UPI002B1F2564|nr:CHASE2 domain-containing protein [Limnoraphis robusta]MEA5497569.1 CHASE2 domain-containing protein [Limnoraphis robusta BA-68 BA1]MEA5542968.1 CHASE2 domain-containing protein [Limnoraphis robusta Tam1]
MLQLSVQHIEQSCLFELTWEQGKRLSSQVTFPQTLMVFYQDWRQAYINYYQTQPSFNPDVTDSNLRGKSAGSGTIQPPVTDWKARLVDTETHLLYEFNEWLRSQKLHEIRVKISDICRKYSSQQKINLGLICGSTELAKLPWESWEIGVEMATTAQLNITRIPNNFTSHPTLTVKRSQPRILAIIGQDGRLNFQQDFLTLQNKLKPLATVKKVGWEPGKSISDLETEIKQAITDEKGWDVLFFAGHSNETNLTGGELGIAPGEFLHIKDISHQLEIAKNNGLKFALFNSCNGLKIAETLINLGLSQVAVMREPIHNQVAGEFLLQFLQNLAEYKDVQESLIAVCNFLNIEKSFTYPSASLIPSLFCYPNTQFFRLQPTGWKHFIRQLLQPKWHEVIALATLSVLSLQLPVQYHLLEQRVKIQAVYRDITGQVPSITPSILLVKIDDLSLTEVGFPDPLINRKYLAQLINHAAKINPDVVGIDYVLKTVQPQEDEVLEASLNAARQNSQSLYIFATSRNLQDERLWTLPKFADINWQGDTRIWENGRYITLLPLENEERPFPLSYLLALGSISAQSEPYLQPKHPTQLTENLFSKWMRPSVLTMISYSFHQYWLHPIVDFSIPQKQVYKSISAQDFLATQPEQVQQPVIFIIPGGYSNAGLNSAGEDNLPAPPGFCYWQNKSYPRRACHIILGGEIHAYLFHHFLNQKPVIPIPDLWVLWLFAFISKGVNIVIEQHEPSSKKVLIFLTEGTFFYGLISLLLYLSASVLFPIIIPVAIIWVYMLPHLRLKTLSKFEQFQGFTNE